MGRHLFRTLVANGFFRGPEKAPPAEPAPQRRMLLERLEDRLLFDAGPVAPVDADAELAQQAQAAQEAMPLESSVAEPAEVRVIETLDQVELMMADLVGQPLDGPQDLLLDPNETPRDELLLRSDQLAQELLTASDDRPVATLAESVGQREGQIVEAPRSGERGYEVPLQSEVRRATEDIRQELVFVDTSVIGYQALLDDLFAQMSPGSVFEIVLLDATLDGVSQVTAVLEGRSDLAAVHILSHGQAGGFQLGATWIDQQTLMGVSGEVSRWASAFAHDGDLLIYGCNLAATAEGQQLIDEFSALTGADVAGSKDLTGSVALGGNWDLEYVHGTVIETIGQDATLGITWNDVLLAAPTAPESRVNTTTANTQETAFASPQAMAIDGAGNYVVTWADSNLDGSGYGVYFQRYSAAGVAQGAETRANTTTLNAQQFPSVDMDSAGNFVIAWSGNGSGDTAGVFAQRFNATGVAQGAEFRVNTTTTNTQQQPSVALDSLGNFVIVWSGEGVGDTAGVFGQRYTAAGATIGSEFRINSTTTGTQSFAAVDMNPKGDFVVVWSGEGTGDLSGVFGQRYDTTGTAVGGEFRVNTTTTNTQQYGRVAMNSAGGFVVTWSGEGTGDTSGVFARRYDSAGTALDATEFRVNTTVANTQQYATVASDSSGNFLVTWTDSASDGSTNGVYAQRYNAAGVAQDVEFRVAGTTANDQQFSSAIIAPNSDFTIVWSGNGTGDTAGVFQRRFDTHLTAMYAASNASPFNISTINLATGATTTVGTSSYSTAANARDPVSGDVFYIEFTNPTARLSRFNPLTGTNTLITTLASLPGNIIKLSFRSDGTLWAASGSPSNTLYQLNPSTGAVISSGMVSTLVSGSGDMAFDSNNVLWWCSGNSLYTVNTTTYVATLINVITPALTINGFAFGPNGTLYAHAGNNLYTINQTTAVATLVGATGTTGIADLGSSSVNVNAAPINSVPATQTTNEDTARVFSAGNGNLISISDVDAGTAAVQVTLTGANGAISLSGTTGLTFTVGDGTTDSAMTFTGTLANINAALAGLSFLPTSNFFGPASLQITTNDQGNTGVGGAMSDTDTIGINVTPVNDAPTTSNNSVTTPEDTPVTFAASSFPFSDVDTGNTLQSVRITVLPTVGTLTLGGVAVTLNQVIPTASLGTLVFTPALNGNGSPYTTFNFQVSDGTVFSGSATMTVNVTPVADPPTTANNSVTTPEDTPVTFAAASFPFSDVDTGDTLQSVRITALPSVGTLTLGGVAVTLNQVIPTASLGTLVFTPVLNGNGSPYTTFNFQVSDGTAYSGSATMTVNVTPVNDPPTTANNSVTTPEDTPVTFAAASFPFSDVDTGNTLQSVRITALPGVGTLTLGGVAVTLNQVIPTASLGTLVFTPVANANGSPYTTFNFQVSDGTAFSGSATMTVNVTPIADPPTTANNSVTTPEDTPVTFAAASFPFSDVDTGDTLQSVRITALPSVGTLTLGGVAVTLNQVIPTASLGTLVFTPVLNGNGSPYTTFNFQVSDGTAFSGSATMTINVTPVNDPPTTANNSVTTPEDTPVTFAAASFPFSDVDTGNTLQSVRITALPSIGTLTLGGVAVTLNQVIPTASLGTLVFTPVANANGSPYTTFNFQVSDGTVFSASATMTVNVTPVNDPPATSNNSVTTPEDTPVTFAAGSFPFSDADTGDSLQSVRILSLPSLGTLTLGGVAVTLNQVIPTASLGTLVFAPALNGNGSPYTTFNFQVSDGTAFSSSATMTIHVTPVNDPLIGGNQTVTTAEDTDFTFTATDFPFSDVDGDPLARVRLDTLPADGMVLLNGAAVSSGQIITAANITAGNLQFRPDANENGSPYSTFTFSVGDATAFAAAPSTMTVNVTPVNDPPIADDETFTVENNASVIIPVLIGDIDPDGDSLTVTQIDGSPISVGSPVTIATGVVSLNADGTLTFTPNVSFTGPASFNYTVSDGNGGSDIGLVSGNVTSANDPPVAVADTNTTTENTNVSGDVLANDSDPDGDPLTVSAVNGAAGNVGAAVVGSNGGSFTINSDGSYTFNPGTDFDDLAVGQSRSTFISYTISDGEGETSTTTVTITVTGNNDAPTSTAIPDRANDDSDTVNVSVSSYFSDPDPGDVLTFSADTLPPGLSLNSATGVISGTLVANASAGSPYSVSITATDFSGAFTAQTFLWVVTNVPTTAYDDFATTPENVSITGNVLANDVDPDGDPLIVAAVNGVAGDVGASIAGTQGGVFTIQSDGAYTFDPGTEFDDLAVGEARTTSIRYTTDDSNGSMVEARVLVLVTGTNDSPTSTAIPAQSSQDNDAVTLNVASYFTDPDASDTFVFSASGLPVGLTIDSVTGAISGTIDHSASVSAPYSTMVTATDPFGAATSQSFTWNVTNPAPTASNDAFTTDEDTPVSGSVTANDSDPDGDTLTYSLVTGPANGAIAFNSDGTFTYSPNLDYYGADSFIYQLSDGEGGTATATVNLTVTPVNDPPIGADSVVTTPEETDFTFSASDFPFFDIEGDVLTEVRIDSLPGDGTLLFNGTPVSANDAISVADINAGWLIFRPDVNENGTPYTTFNFSVSDGTSFAAVSNTLTVNVTPTTVSVVKSLFDSSDPDTIGSDVTIGEELCFALLVTLSEGNSSDLILTDLLPDGLLYDSWTLITTTAAANGLLSGDFNGSVPAPSVSGGTFDGEDVTFTFGAITVAADGNTANNSFVLLVHVFVSDVPSNHNPLLGQPTLTNIATADVSNPQPPVSSNPFDVTVVEPDMSVTIDNGLATLTAGQTTSYSITIANDGDSLATGLVLSGSLPMDRITFVSTDDAANFSIDGSGNFTWTPAVASLAPSGTLTLLLTVQVSNSLAAGISDVTIPVSVTHNNIEPTPANNSAADSDTLNAAPDLQLIKTDFAASTTPGAGAVYTINVANSGTQASTNVLVTETVPTGTSYNAALSDPLWMLIAPDTYQISLPTLAAGASFNINFAVTVNSSITAGQTEIANTVTISDDGSNGPDPNPGDNSATDTNTLIAQPDYQITITDGELVVVPGQSLSYSISFTNAGDQDGTGIVVTDTFPTAILENVVASDGGVVDAVAGTITWNVGSLTVGASRSFTVTAKVRDTVPAGFDDFTHDTSITDDLTNGADPTPANNAAADTDTLNATPDYRIAITDGETAVAPGQLLSYTVSFLNAGYQAGTGVVVSDTFPPAILENVIASDGGVVDAVAGTITWNVGNLAAGESRSFTVTAKVCDTIPAGLDDFTHATTISDDATNGVDPTPADNAATDTDVLNALPDYQISIDDGVLSATAGQSLTYSVTFANTGLQDGLGVVVSNSLPLAVLTNVVASNGGIVDLTTGTISWNVGSLTAGASLTYTVTADVLNSFAAGLNDFTHSAAISDDGTNGTDPTPANNSASDTDTLDAAPDLRLTKTDFTNSISPGQGSVYTLNVGNFGTQGATNVRINEMVPDGTTFNATLSDPDWTNVGGNVYQYSILSLPAGASFNINFSVLINNPAVAGQGQIINTATITDDGTNGPDLDPTNNSATDLNTLDALPNYDIGIDDLQVTATPGETLTYFVNFNNYGLQNGTGVVISASFPTAILTNVIASNGGIVDAVAGTITWNVGALPANDPRTFTVTAEVRATMPSGATDFTLTAAITDDGTNGPDPDLSDNSAADTDTLNAQPDYAITIDDGTTFVQPGDPLTYTINVANNGNQDGNGVVVTVSFPTAVLEDVVASNGGVVDGVAGTITWNLGELAAGDSMMLTVNTQIRGNINSQTTSITLTATVTDDGLNGPDPTPLNNLDRDLDSFQIYFYDSFHDWKDMRVAWLMPQTQTVGRPLTPLPVDPVFSGLTEPGSTLVARIYDADGRLLGDRQVVADAGGNWLITFPNIIIYEYPHRMEIIVTPAISNVAHENGFNFRRYFHPAIHAGLVMTESLSIAGVFRNRAYNIVEAQHTANTHPLGFQWYSHAYELNAASSNISQM